MKNIIYRKLEKTDYSDIRNLISNAFGLDNYIMDKKALEKAKKIYLYSCLAEQKFNMVAQYEGEIVGIIMGSSNHDNSKVSNIINVIKLFYHMVSVYLFSRKECGVHSNIHKAYRELIKDCKHKFNGVLTLFAVKEDMRGLGIGKYLLSQLLCYYEKNQSNSIYLYTDNTCNYGFYEHMGFYKIKEKPVDVIRKNKKTKMDVYLYSLKISNNKELTMIDKTKIVIRNAKKTDNVNQIAKLIYSSDLNIYGSMFGNEINACKVLQNLIHNNTININIRNLIVAVYEEDTIAILCFIEDNYFDDKESYQSKLKQLNIPIPKHFNEIFDIYWKKIISENFIDTYYISNIAVNSNYQNLGIGKKLLKYFIENHSDKPISLDVVQDNVWAIHVYSKSKFKVVNTKAVNKDKSVPIRMVYNKK